jgi:hypothetical protein
VTIDTGITNSIVGRNFLIKHLLAAAVLTVASAANATWFTGNQLLGHMQGEPFERGGAAGFVTGVASAIDGDLACIPAEVTVSQMRDMVYRTLQNRPDIRHQAAELIVAAVLMEQFPCQESRPGRGAML